MQYNTAIRKRDKAWINHFRRDVEFVMSRADIDRFLPSLDGPKKSVPPRPKAIEMGMETTGVCRDISMNTYPSIQRGGENLDKFDQVLNTCEGEHNLLSSHAGTSAESGATFDNTIYIEPDTPDIETGVSMVTDNVPVKRSEHRRGRKKG